jgi:hypothetical protein
MNTVIIASYCAIDKEFCNVFKCNIRYNGKNIIIESIKTFVLGTFTKMNQLIILRFEPGDILNEYYTKAQGHTKTESDGNHALKTQLIGGNLIDLLHVFVENFIAAVDMIIKISDALKNQHFLQWQYLFARKNQLELY